MCNFVFVLFSMMTDDFDQSVRFSNARILWSTKHKSPALFSIYLLAFGACALRSFSSYFCMRAHSASLSAVEGIKKVRWFIAQ